MGILLGSDRKVQCLKWKCAATIKLAQQLNDGLVDSNGAHVLVEFPSILEPPPADSLVAIQVGEVDPIAWPQIVFYAIDPAVQNDVRKVEDCIAFFMEIIGDPLFVHREPPIRLDHGEQWGFDQGQAGKDIGQARRYLVQLIYESESVIGESERNSGSELSSGHVSICPAPAIAVLLF
ncbi:hypothetical protein Sbs19_38480 [Sphingobium sp. BS19]|nr:hypothetical protein Sbs19_38480 [Sphingobium sp. BS19]